MGLPGFSAESSLIKSRQPYNPITGKSVESIVQSLVIPQARQSGPGGINGIVQYCWSANECYLYHCDDTGCHPLGFTSF